MTGGTGWCIECEKPYEAEDLVVDGRTGESLCRWHARARLDAQVSPPEPVAPEVKPLRAPQPLTNEHAPDGFAERRDMATNRRGEGWRWGAKRSQRRKRWPWLQVEHEQRDVRAHPRRQHNRRRSDRDD